MLESILGDCYHIYCNPDRLPFFTHTLLYLKSVSQGRNNRRAWHQEILKAFLKDNYYNVITLLL